MSIVKSMDLSILPPTGKNYYSFFGRDADTIASMVGALAGAFAGVSKLDPGWVEQIEATGSFQRELAQQIIDIILERAKEMAEISNLILA